MIVGPPFTVPLLRDTLHRLLKYSTNPMDPAASVRGPKRVVKRGKTPVLTAGEARQLLDSISLKIVPNSLEGVEDELTPLIGPA
jgi:hypothetical protein